jgi:hypothetical protein
MDRDAHVSMADPIPSKHNFNVIYHPSIPVTLRQTKIDAQVAETQAEKRNWKGKSPMDGERPAQSGAQTFTQIIDKRLSISFR